MFLEDCMVLENIKISDSYYLLKLKSEKSIALAKPGQFYMLQCKNKSTLLRRPISLHYISKNKNIIEFYYEVKGEGTKDFKNIKSGEIINLQGPLGNGFDIQVEKKNIVVIGGGMGMAPMKFLIDILSKKNNVTFISGGRNKNSIKILENFNLETIKTIITTDDGSLGIKGNVTVPLLSLLKEMKVDKIYACGPSIMMKHIMNIADSKNISCEVSLEERMACGVGACVGCSILTKNGMKKVCKDGPVFNSKIIINK